MLIGFYCKKHMAKGDWRNRSYLILSIVLVVILVIAPIAFLFNAGESQRNQKPSISFAGGVTDYVWSENFSSYGGFMKNVSSLVAIHGGGNGTSHMDMSLFQIGFGNIGGNPTMNMYMGLSGSLLGSLKPAYLEINETSYLGNGYPQDSGSISNPGNTINMSLVQPSTKDVGYTGNSVQRMHVIYIFHNESHSNGHSYNFSLSSLNFQFLFNNFPALNQSVILTFQATIYGLSENIPVIINVVMNDIGRA